MDASHIADELLTASTALAGLILVFVGNAVSGWDSYGAQQQHAVRRKYQRRGWFGFSGFAAALGSAVLALLYNWAAVPCVIFVSAGLFVISLGVVCFAALAQVREIK
jgi:hypothetical protein